MAASSAVSKVQGAGITNEMSDEERSAAMGVVPLTMTEAASMLDLQDAAIVAFLERWSLPRPLPTIENVSDLDRDLYRALAAATRDLAVTALTSRVDFEPTPNPSDGSPTGGSATSSGPLTAVAEPMSTGKPQTAGESTATASSTTA